MIVRTAAKRAVNASFELATAGWVLGPLGERNYLDTVLPEEFVAMSAIEEELGWFPPDPSFLEVKRPKWTIPWMEDDGALGVSAAPVGSGCDCCRAIPLTCRPLLRTGAGVLGLADASARLRCADDEHQRPARNPLAHA